MIARIYGKWIPTADDFAGSKAVKLFSGNTDEIRQRNPAYTMAHYGE